VSQFKLIYSLFVSLM